MNVDYWLGVAGRAAVILFLGACMYHPPIVVYLMGVVVTVAFGASIFAAIK